MDREQQMSARYRLDYRRDHVHADFVSCRYKNRPLSSTSRLRQKFEEYLSLLDQLSDDLSSRGDSMTQSEFQSRFDGLPPYPR